MTKELVKYEKDLTQTDIRIPDAVELEPFSKEDKKEAAELRKTVDAILVEVHDLQTTLNQRYVKFGMILFEIQKKQYWQLFTDEQGVPFHSFGSYIKSLKQTGRTQAYQYISVAENVLPHVTEDQLELMGVTRATEIARVVKQTGRIPSEELIEKALDEKVSIEELRAFIFEKYHLKDEREPGTYCDLGGVFLSVDEKKELFLAFDYAQRLDPVVEHTLPEHAKKKEILLRMARECISTWGPEVLGEGRG